MQCYKRLTWSHKIWYKRSKTVLRYFLPPVKVSCGQIFIASWISESASSPKTTPYRRHFVLCCISNKFWCINYLIHLPVLFLAQLAVRIVYLFHTCCTNYDLCLPVHLKILHFCISRFTLCHYDFFSYCY